MAKPTTFATPICLILTVLMIIGILTSWYAENALVMTFFMLPVAGYEAYRTEGEHTRWASWLLLLILIGEIILIIMKINFNLASFMGTNEQYITGFYLPLGDIKIVGPMVMALLSIILLIRTYGIYTKWLAILLFAGAFLIVYILDPNIFQELLRTGADQGLRQM